MEINLDKIALDLYGKIQTRFPNIEIGDEHGDVLSKKSEIPKARFFEFEYKENGVLLGTITIDLDEDDGVVMQISGDLANSKHHRAFKFIRSFRQFAKDRLLKFDVQNIGKDNLDKRDYAFKAKPKEVVSMEPMMESKLYGTNRISYQDLGEARLVIKHSQPVNLNLAAGRTMHIESIYVENAEGERFKYPFKHLNGARALAEHIKAGGNPYDSIGKHITGLSEELASLRKFKGYVSRQSQLSEAMENVTSRVLDRIEEIKETISKLQRPAYYQEFAESFEEASEVVIPEEIQNDLINRLTIKTFNEELKSVFPYIYKFVNETELPVLEVNPDDLLEDDEEESNVERGYNESEESYFEAFIDSLVAEDETAQEGENTLFSPNKAVQKAAIDKFNDIMQSELKGGPAGINVVDSLKGIIDDPAILDQLKDIDPDLDARAVIQQQLSDLAASDKNVARIIPFLNFAGATGEEPIGGANLPEPAPAAPPVPPAAPAPAAPPVPPAAPAPVAESKARAGLIKAIHNAKKAGATLETKLDFGHREMTLHDCIIECGMMPEDFGFDAEQEGNGVEEMLKSVSGFWNPQERNFTIGGTRAKTKIVKDFKNGEFPNASEDDVKHVLMMINKMDPSGEVQQGPVDEATGQEQDEFNAMMQQFMQKHQGVNPDEMLNKFVASHPDAKVTRTSTSSGSINGKPASYDDAVKSMPKISFGGQDFDVTQPDQMHDKIKGMMGGMASKLQGQVPNQNTKIPGGQLNPHDMLNQIMRNAGLNKE